jgi:hypothetical protein
MHGQRICPLAQPIASLESANCTVPLHLDIDWLERWAKATPIPLIRPDEIDHFNSNYNASQANAIY